MGSKGKHASINRNLIPTGFLGWKTKRERKRFLTAELFTGQGKVEVSSHVSKNCFDSLLPRHVSLDHGKLNWAIYL